jgi:hypothetical protein
MEKQLRTMLVNMQTCSNFKDCGADYAPKKGHVPRGFSGATCNPDEVYLVIVSAQPSKPFTKDKKPFLEEIYSGDPVRDVDVVLGAEYLRSSATDYHANIRTFMNDVFQNVSSHFDRQLKHVWVTQSRHCSIVEKPGGKKSGNIGKPVRLICSRTHLVEQVKLFPNAIVLLAGSKAREAREEIARLRRPISSCFSFAPLNSQKVEAKESHQQAAIECKDHVDRMIAERS